MASLQVKCPNPKCKRLNSIKRKACSNCGASFRGGKNYYIQYTNPEGKKEREHIGPNKEAAEQRLRDVLSDIAKGRYLKKSLDTCTQFEALAEWYLTLDRVKKKQSYDRDKRSIGKLCAFFGGKLLKDITPALVDKYVTKRLSEPSYRKHLTKPATVNRELACMKTIFRKAIANKKAESTPFMPGTKLMVKENNARKRELLFEEYPRLMAECPAYIEPVVKLALYTGMREGEIINLKWGRVNLRKGFIQLLDGYTKDGGAKNGEGRKIPLPPEMVAIFKAMPHGLPDMPVFTRKGKAITASTIRVGLGTACKRAGIKGFTFHDLRRTAKTNMLRAGVDKVYRDSIVGHKLTGMDAHYIVPSEDDLHREMARYAEWLNQELEAAASKIGHPGHPTGHPASINTTIEIAQQA